MDKGKLRKIVTILTTITVIITFISVGLNFILPIYLSYKLHKEVGKIGSIGIIGGADGPTAIFITSRPFSGVTTIIFTLFSIVGILYLVLNKKTME